MRKSKLKHSHKLMAIKRGQEIARVSCYRKKSFTLDQAEARAKIYEQRIYMCPRCGSYHLTKNVGEYE